MTNHKAYLQTGGEKLQGLVQLMDFPSFLFSMELQSGIALRISRTGQMCIRTKTDQAVQSRGINIIQSELLRVEWGT